MTSRASRRTRAPKYNVGNEKNGGSTLTRTILFSCPFFFLGLQTTKE